MTSTADAFRAGLLGIQMSNLPYELLLLAIERLSMFPIAVKVFKSARYIIDAPYLQAD